VERSTRTTCRITASVSCPLAAIQADRLPGLLGSAGRSRWPPTLWAARGSLRTILNLLVTEIAVTRRADPADVLWRMARGQEGLGHWNISRVITLQVCIAFAVFLAGLLLQKRAMMSSASGIQG